MTKRIFRTTLLTSLLISAFCIFLIVGTLFTFFEDQIKKELADEAEYVSYVVESSGTDEFFSKFSKKDKRITLISENGEVLADTKANPADMDNHLNREEIKEAINDGSGTSVRYSNTLTQKTIYCAKKLDDGNIIRVSTTQYTVLTIVLGLIQPLLFVFAVALILALLMSSKASKGIIKPINSIDLDNPEECITYDELSPLLRKIAIQNQTIKNQIEDAKQKQKEFKIITENMSEGFLVIDKNANLLSYNTSALKLLDTETTDGSVLALNRSIKFIDSVSSALGGKRAENTMIHENKTYNIIATPVYEKDKIAGAVILIIDITESAEREEIRREFAANVSHELKTPLTSISGFAELMKEGGIPENNVKDFSSSIYSEAQRLISLISDIIKISELDEKDNNLTTEKVDLYSLSEDIVKRLQKNADKRNITITLSGEHAEITGVKQILDEMVYNLTDNAIKYNVVNGKVYISVHNDNDTVKLSVKDTGIGIPGSQQDRVFERFYRIDKSHSKAQGGTGLGLSIVKRGAAYHNARINLVSEPKKGTEITITFSVTK